MKLNKLAAAIGVLLSLAAAAPVIAVAKDGADESVTCAATAVATTDRTTAEPRAVSTHAQLRRSDEWRGGRASPLVCARSNREMEASAVLRRGVDGLLPLGDQAAKLGGHSRRTSLERPDVALEEPDQLHR